MIFVIFQAEYFELINRFLVFEFSYSDLQINIKNHCSLIQVLNIYLIITLFLVLKYHFKILNFQIEIKAIHNLKISFRIIFVKTLIYLKTFLFLRIFFKIVFFLLRNLLFFVQALLLYQSRNLLIPDTAGFLEVSLNFLIWAVDFHFKIFKLK